MSGAKRTVIDRPRKALIDFETLAMFVTLENVPLRRRRSDEFKRRSRELARRLNLHDEWFFSRTDVLDRTRGPCHPPGYVAHDAWFRCRAVRLQLLEAAGLSEPRRTRAS
jgi:hypothetical protein